MNSEDVIRSANAMSPEPLLRSLFGNLVKSKNGHISIKGILRADEKGGRWVACDWYGTGIGGTISIISHVYGVGFKDSVEMLTGVSLNTTKRLPSSKPHRVRRSGLSSSGRPDCDKLHGIILPKLIPPTEDGRNYLIGRGISKETIAMCEANGSLGYTENAVVFVGRSEDDEIKYAASRYLKNQIDEDGEVFNKKDAVGSSKVFCFCIPPAPRIPYDTYLVEGGVNALSLYEILARQNRNAFILTTGSVSARKWMENPDYIALIDGGGRCFMVGENETASETRSANEKQRNTDKARYGVISDLKDRIRVPVSLTYPPTGYGDVNDYLKAIVLDDEISVDMQIRKLVEALDGSLPITKEDALKAVETLSMSIAESFKIPWSLASKRQVYRSHEIVGYRDDHAQERTSILTQESENTDSNSIDSADCEDSVTSALSDHVAPDAGVRYMVRRKHVVSIDAVLRASIMP